MALRKRNYYLAVYIFVWNYRTKNELFISYTDATDSELQVYLLSHNLCFRFTLYRVAAVLILFCTHTMQYNRVAQIQSFIAS